MSKPPRLPDTWPGAQVMANTEPVYPIPPETEYSIRLRIGMSKSQPPHVHEAARELVNAMGFAQVCPRGQCQRAGSCQTRYVNCSFERREIVIEALRQMGARG